MKIASCLILLILYIQISLLGVLIFPSCILCNDRDQVIRYYGTHMITNTTNTPDKPAFVSNASHRDDKGKQYQLQQVCPFGNKCQMQRCRHVENRYQIGRDIQNENQCQIDEDQLGLPWGDRLKNQYQTRRICRCGTQNPLQQSHRLENE